MSGYLLDTNTVYAWNTSDHSQHAHVMSAIGKVPALSPVRISVVTRGEIAFGHEFKAPPDQSSRAEYMAWIDSTFPRKLEVSATTALIYGKVRAELCRKCKPPGGWNRKKRAEQLVDPVSARELRIDENDLWLAAQALEHNFVLVTEDKMDEIVKAIQRIDNDSYANYKAFSKENWCKPSVKEAS